MLIDVFRDLRWSVWVETLVAIYTVALSITWPETVITHTRIHTHTHTHTYRPKGLLEGYN